MRYRIACMLVLLTALWPREEAALGFMECTREGPLPDVTLFVDEAKGVLTYDLERNRPIRMEIVENNPQYLQAVGTSRIVVLTKRTRDFLYVWASVSRVGELEGGAVRGRCAPTTGSR